MCQLWFKLNCEIVVVYLNATLMSDVILCRDCEMDQLGCRSWGVGGVFKVGLFSQLRSSSLVGCYFSTSHSRAGRGVMLLHPSSPNPSSDNLYWKGQFHKDSTDNTLNGNTVGNTIIGYVPS